VRRDDGRKSVSTVCHVMSFIYSFFVVCVRFVVTAVVVVVVVVVVVLEFEQIRVCSDWMVAWPAAAKLQK